MCMYTYTYDMHTYIHSIVAVASLYRYTMESSNKDIQFDSNPLWE